MVCIRVRDARAWWYWDHCLLATGRGGDEPPGQKAESPMSPAGKEGLPALLTLPGGTDLPPQNTSWGARLGTRQRRGATLPLALESLWSRKRDFCPRATEKIGRFLTKKKQTSSSLGSFGVTLNRILSISYSRVKPLEQASLALTTSSEGSPLPLPQSAAVRFRGQ